jgi:type I restriction enzyme S subunit
MTWKTTTFGEVVKLEQGLAFNKKNNFLMVDEGIPLLRITELINNTESKFVDRNKVPLKFLSKPTDIIFTRTGEQVGLVFKGRVGIVHNNCFRIIPIEGIDPNYVYWYLKQPSVREHARNLAGGVAQPDLAHDAFKSIPFRYPPYPDQQKIVFTLSTYADLIDNNTKRIKILEEIVQALYREWFVNFRFPGYEDVRMMESELGPVPMGWKIQTVEDLCDYISRGVTPKYELGSRRLIINQRANEGSEINTLNLKELKSDFIVPDEKKARTGDLLINCLGEGTIGRAHLFLYPDNEWAVDQHMSICRSSNLAYTAYLYFVMVSPEGQSKIQTLKQGGTNMTTFNISTLKAFELIVPPDELLNHFYMIILDLYRIKGTFQRKNTILCRTRDLLLQKLISGEIDVSGLDIKISKPEA